MSNVFPVLLSINVFALLQYTVRLCLMVLSLPREWPCTTPTHYQCKWFFSRLGHFKTFYSWRTDKNKLNNKDEPLTLNLLFQLWMFHFHVAACVSNQMKLLWQLKEKLWPAGAVTDLQSWTCNMCSQSSRWFSLTKHMLFTINIISHHAERHNRQCFQLCAFFLFFSKYVCIFDLFKNTDYCSCLLFCLLPVAQKAVRSMS